MPTTSLPTSPLRTSAVGPLAILRDPAQGAVDQVPFDAASFEPTMREPDGKLPNGGSRRQRLWELATHCHCPVIGVCLPLGQLRRLITKATGQAPVGDDYDVHVGAVNECRRRDALSEALQRDLDQRHAAQIRRFGRAKSASAMLELWSDCVTRGDVAAGLWAALTHPRCDPATLEKVYRDIHMLQHQAGAATRSERNRTATLIDEEASLREALEQTRDRYRQLQAEKTREAATLGTALMRARADLIARDTMIAGLREELATVRREAHDLDSRKALEERVQWLTERHRDLVPDAASDRIAPADSNAATGGTPAATEVPVNDVADSNESPGNEALAEDRPLPLGERAVLCVGGRHAAISVYRRIVEKRGGRFLHHDGGREDNVHRLDANLAAADLVVCQAGCISHSAYWLVKDHCKRTGKRCIYLQKPSASAFARGLAMMEPVALSGAAT